MKLILEVQTESSISPQEYFESKIDEDGNIIKNDDFDIRVSPTPIFHLFPDGFVITLIINIVTSIGCGLLANWLYDKIKNKKVTINNKIAFIESINQLNVIINNEFKNNSFEKGKEK